MAIELLHQGFDGLDLAFKAQLKVPIAGLLARARDDAATRHEPQLVNLAGHPVHVLEGGARGGYRYKCDTGPLGAIWFFKTPSARDPWGVRVTVKSLPLAKNGIHAVYEELKAFVAHTCSNYSEEDVSIGRVDYALDFLLDGFVLTPDQFVMHSRLTRTEDRESSEVGRSGRVYSVRIGKMPGQQIAFYDKRSDVLSKSKLEWWEIWNSNLSLRDLPPICPGNTKNRIWRIEFRAGKHFLKKQKSITSLEEFLQVGGSLFAEMADGIRYTFPCEDTNRARWPSHPIWSSVQSHLALGLSEMMGAISSDRVREITRSKLIELLEQQIVGCAATQLVAMELDDVEVCDQARVVSDRLIALIQADPKRFCEKLRAATDRYHFIVSSRV